jgi:hypothetical protein
MVGYCYKPTPQKELPANKSADALDGQRRTEMQEVDVRINTKIVLFDSKRDPKLTFVPSWSYTSRLAARCRESGVGMALTSDMMAGAEKD